MVLTVLSLSQLFCGIFFLPGLSHVFFSLLDKGYVFLERMSQNTIISYQGEYMISLMMLILNLVKVVFARLRSKVNIFSFLYLFFGSESLSLAHPYSG